MPRVEIDNEDADCVEEDATTVEVATDEYVLDALEKAGHVPPYSCREGMCTSCVARVLEGEFDREGTGLDPQQREEYVLTCSATPETDCRLALDVQDELFQLQGGL